MTYHAIAHISHVPRTIALSLIVPFVIVALLGRPIIALLKRLSFKQNAYEDAPKTHAVKSGTPTMGGVMIALGIAAFPLYGLLLIAAIGPTSIGDYVHAPYVAIVALALVCGAIGFADDILGIRRGRNRGLGAREKFALTILAAILFVAWDATSSVQDTTLLAFGAFAFHVPTWVWCLLSVAAILATTHAVNLTDGLDGLASVTIVPPLAVFLAIALTSSYLASFTFTVAASTIGSVLGFLIYNRHPAKVFMGDTGSLLLGGVLAGCAIALDQQLLLLLVGGVFVAEALSVIMQVAYFKRTGKRIFKMSPLHHHFELLGWPETKVTTRFWAASAALSLVGAATFFVPMAIK